MAHGANTSANGGVALAGGSDSTKPGRRGLTAKLSGSVTADVGVASDGPATAQQVSAPAKASDPHPMVNSFVTVVVALRQRLGGGPVRQA
jgi:hypothetical protein